MSWKDPITDRYYGYFSDKERSLDKIDDFGKQESDSLLIVEERCAAAYNYADVNGSLNILRKCKPTAFANGVQGVVVRPRVVLL